MDRRLRDTIGAVAATVAVGLALVVALAAFGVDSGQEVVHARHAPPQDLNVKPSDFQNLHTMTMVRGSSSTTGSAISKPHCASRAPGRAPIRSAPSSNSCPKRRW